MKILVRLTPDEVRRAAYGGVDRRISAMLDGRRGRRHENIPLERQQWWQTTIIGARWIIRGTLDYIRHLEGELRRARFSDYDLGDE